MSKNNYTYSVIIPHHGIPDLLKQAVASVPVRDDIQLIVIEDEEGRGAGWARNQGLAQAKGKWLLFLDADDYFTPEAFEAFDRHRDDEADLIYFRMTSMFTDTGEPSNREAHINKLTDAYLAAPTERHEGELRYHFHEPVAKMVRREIVTEHDILFEEVRWANDSCFSQLVGHYANQIAVDAQTVYVIRVRRGSLVYQRNLESRRCRYEVMLRCNQRLRKWGKPEYQESIMFSLRRALQMGGVKALWEFIQIGRAYEANFLIGADHWIQNFFNREEDKGKQKYIVS